MKDTPPGMKINFDEKNMTKWEVLMDGPDQSAYAVCCSTLYALSASEHVLIPVGRSLQARNHLPKRISLQAAGR